MTNIPRMRGIGFDRFQTWLKRQWNHLPIIDRWLLGEIIPPVIFGISAFSTLSLSLAEILDLIQKVLTGQIAINSASIVILFKLPGYMVLSFPMATLFGCLIAFSSLSSNSEIKALLSLGINSRRIISSAVIVGLAMTLITFFFNNAIVPYSNTKAANELTLGIGSSLHKEDITYSKFSKDEELKILFHAKRYTLENKTMKNITLIDQAKEGKSLITAEKGLWSESEKKWKFIKGSIHRMKINEPVEIINFSEYKYDLTDKPFEIANLPSNPSNMTLSQAIYARNLYKLSGNKKEERRLRVRIQEKLTMPFSCLIFSIIGTSLAIKQNKIKGEGRSLAFGVSIILIFIYYTVSFIFSSFGVSGILHPILAAWSPVFIFLGGSFLMNYETNTIRKYY